MSRGERFTVQLLESEKNGEDGPPLSIPPTALIDYQTALIDLIDPIRPPSPSRSLLLSIASFLLLDFPFVVD